MLNQLIYTRCKPHRDLKNKGNVARSDGFGVFSMSRGLATDPPVSDYTFLQARLAAHNGAKENSAAGLFHSYEYTALDSGVYALSFEVARPLCKEQRKNGRTHRPGVFIKQCLVGTPEDYPVQWFGASVWDAHLKSQNDYYLDEDPTAEPEWLPMVQVMPEGSYITTEKIRQFVHEGRKEAVKAGIWFLIQEYAKPENERKVLLIKDTPDNVELWIAAMEYAFSEEMAKKITFSTNKSRLAIQIDNMLFYYTDETGRFYPMHNNSVTQVRHPYHMIAGYHPKDNFCATVKQMPTSNFVLIDGTTKTTGIIPDDSIHAEYYSAAVEYNDDLIDFTGVVLPSLPLAQITDQIPALYDAYKYLLDSNHKVETWIYREAVARLQTLTQYGISRNEALNRYLLDEGMRGYQRFAAEDERNQFRFLKILWEISRSVNRAKEVTGCLADQLSAKMANLRASGHGLTATWNAIKAGGAQEIVRPAMADLFNDSELADCSNQFGTAPSSVVSTILSMYYDTLSMEKNGIQSIMESNEKKQFLCRGMLALTDDEHALREALRGISSSSDVLNMTAMSVSQYLEEHKPAKTEMWWDSIIEVSGGNVMEMCRTLCRSPKADMDMIEHLLENAVLKARRCERDHYRAFEDSIRTLGKKQNTGVVFFRACIKVEEPSRLDNLIRNIRDNRLYLSAEKELFRLVDETLPYDSTSGMISHTFQEMDHWAEELGETSISAALYHLRRQMGRERKVERLLPVMYEFIKLEIALPKSLLRRQYFADLAQHAAEFCHPEVHMAFLHLFDISDTGTQQEYIRIYTDEVLSCAKGRQLASAMLSLCDAFSNEYKIPGRTAVQVKGTANLLKSYFTKILPDYYKSSLAEQVSKVNDYNPKVKRMLLEMLEEAEKKAPKSGLGSFLGGIFGKK